MSDPTTPLDRLAAKAGQFYSLPVVAMKVLELTNNPKVDIAALKRCIENDPALTTKVLRVVNSSLFGLSREVSDLNQALALLGTKPLKLLVLGFSLPEPLFDGVAADILGWYWQHTLTKAVAAREISETFGRQSGDEAFIAGLLQDLGILLLIQELGDTYVRFLEKVLARGGDLVALETASLGFDHTMLTSRLLRHWGLPEVLVEAMRRSGAPPPAASTSSAPSLSQVVHWAGLVAQLVADGRSDALSQLLALGDGSQGLSPEQLDQLVGSLRQKVEQLADVLSLRLPEGRDYHHVLVEAHVQLAQVAAEVPEDLVAQRESRRTLQSESQAFAHECQSLSDAVAKISQPGPASAPLAPGGRRAPEPAAVRSSSQPAVSSSGRSGPVDTRTQGRAVVTSADAEIDPGLLGQLDAAVSACRRSQCALSLLLVELDEVERLTITYGVEGLGKLRRFLETGCASVDHPQAVCLPYRDVGFAVILPDCERQPAVRYANQLIDRVRGLTPGRWSPGRRAVGISVGAATLSVPTKSFPPENLFEAAHRCLYGSRASGGVVKSIEIY